MGQSIDMESIRFTFSFFIALLFSVGAPPGALAQDQGEFGKVIRIERSAFKADAGLITFSERRLNTQNPVYRGPDYRGAPDGVVVSFAGFFVGQRLGMSAQCPPGANRQGCVVGRAQSPLQLDYRSPATFVAEDGSNPTSPSLSGTPRFNGPVSILFDRDIAGVGLAGGYFNAIRSTAITAFDRNGVQIGGVKNLKIGMEYMALVTEDGSNRIAGLQFSLVGAEPAGYAIDELSFAFAGQIDRGQVRGLADALAGEITPAEDAAPTQKPAGGLSGLFGGGGAAVPAPSPDRDPAPRAAGPAKPAGGLSDLFGN